MTVSAEKQGKHQPEHKNFDDRRSELIHPDPQALIREFAGTGQQIGDKQVGQPGSKERVDCQVQIGNYAPDRSGTAKIPTTIGIFHYSASDVHIVPGRPKELDDGK